MTEWGLMGSYEDWADRSRARQASERLRDVLAESTASDVKGLRLALARIVVEEHGVRSYGGGCHCSGGGKGCSGHVPKTMKIARAALGLAAVPDRDQVLTPPKPAPKKKRTTRKAAK